MPRHPPRPPAPEGASDYRAIMESFAAYVKAERPDLSSPRKVADLLRPVLAEKMQEECHALLFGTRNRLIRDEVVADRRQLHPCEVFRAAIRCDGGCTRIILAHNHPSGDTTTWPQDLAITRQIADAGRIVGIELVDHVILGRKSEPGPGLPQPPRGGGDSVVGETETISAGAATLPASNQPPWPSQCIPRRR